MKVYTCFSTDFTHINVFLDIYSEPINLAGGDV